MTKEEDILEIARKASESAPSWADLSNALFDQTNGILAKAFSTAEERTAFAKSDTYLKLKELIQSAQGRTGLVKGATPTKSGKLLVRLPKTMHAALEEEASDEGVSLNQLVVAKLAVQMSQLRIHDRLDWIPKIVQAFAEIRDGASEDRLIADPELDARFLSRCRELGAEDTDFELNKKLLYARKKGYTANLPHVPRFRIPRAKMDRFQYASEIALRYVQRKEEEQSGREISLDSIICDPILASAFDGYAARLAPGFSPFEYRWAALGLRKAGRYMKEAMAEEMPLFEDLGRTTSLNLDKVPSVQGLYLVQNRGERLFVGETQNLRQRVHTHIEVAGPQMVPTWLFSGNERDTRLSIVPLPSVAETRLKAVELRAILALAPLLNYSRAA